LPVLPALLALPEALEGGTRRQALEGRYRRIELALH